MSFAEILMRKSVAGFEAVSTSPDGSVDSGAAFRWATLCFFGGMLVVAALDKVGFGGGVVGCLRPATRLRTQTELATAGCVRRQWADRSSTLLHPPARPQVVHLLAHWGVQRSQRKAGAGGGGGSAGASTVNLLSHEDQRNARPTKPPAVATMLKRPSAAGADVEATGSAAATPRAGADAAAPPPSEAGDDASSTGADGGSSSVGTHVHELSAPVLLTEPCDAMTSAVVAASCPDTVAAAAGEPGAKPEVRRGGEGLVILARLWLCTGGHLWRRHLQRGCSHTLPPARCRAQGEAGGGATTSRTPPAVVEIMENDHHAFMLKKMGE